MSCYTAHMEAHGYQARLEALLQGGRRYNFAKGQIIRSADDWKLLNLLVSGYVKRYYITSDGTEHIQSIYGPGDLYPLTPIFQTLFNMRLNTTEGTVYYQAITPISIFSVQSSIVDEALANDPLLHKELLYVCGLRLRSNIQRLENTSLKNTTLRIAHQLLFFAETFGVQEGNTATINLPLTHQTISEVVNASRETVTLSLSQLAKSGLVQTSPKLTILDMDGLREMVS